MDVGLLDVDICGPSVPRMLGLLGQDVHQSSEGWSPIYVDDHLAVMSIGFMLPNQESEFLLFVYCYGSCWREGPEPIKKRQCCNARPKRVASSLNLIKGSLLA